MPSVLQALTWEDIKDLPESAGRTEIVDGELVLSPTPSRRHQEAATNLGVVITPFVKRHKLAKFYSSAVHVILAPHVNFEPDLCFVARGRTDLGPPPALDGPPDLAIEILSPGNRRHDLVTKLRNYEQYGVREYWIVDLDSERISVYKLLNDRYAEPESFGPGEAVDSTVLAGLGLDPADVFGDLDF